MPPTKQRTADYRRAQAERDRRKGNQPAVVRADRKPKSEAYNRNKRAASKVAVRDWQDW